MSRPDIVDTHEAAQRLNVQPGTIHQWRQRDIGFPPPYRRLTIGPIWLWPHIHAWAKETDRL